jgi:hypothetical protein
VRATSAGKEVEPAPCPSITKPWAAVNLPSTRTYRHQWVRYVRPLRVLCLRPRADQRRGRDETADPELVNLSSKSFDGPLTRESGRWSWSDEGVDPHRHPRSHRRGPNQRWGPGSARFQRPVGPGEPVVVLGEAANRRPRGSVTGNFRRRPVCQRRDGRAHYRGSVVGLLPQSPVSVISSSGPKLHRAPRPHSRRVGGSRPR